MALVWLDSFDHYLTADLPVKYGTAWTGVSINTTQGRRAGGCLATTANHAVMTNPLPVVSTTAILGVALKLNSGNSANDHHMEVRSGSSTQVTFALDATGTGRVYRGTASGGTLLGTASATFPITTYVYVELKVVIHLTAGSIVLRYNEAEVLNVTGVNTAATGVETWNVAMLGNQSSGITTNCYYDDFYVCDGSGSAPLNGFLGDCRIDARYPTGAGSTTAWTPSAGANYACVDEVTPNADTDYVSTATIGATDTYAVQDAAVPGAVIYGVQLCVDLKKSDAGTCSVAPVVRHAGTDFPGTAVNPGTAYAYAVVPYGTNPGTGAAWTEAGFNAAEFGIKRTA